MWTQFLKYNGSAKHWTEHLKTWYTGNHFSVLNWNEKKKTSVNLAAIDNEKLPLYNTIWMIFYHDHGI